MGDPQILLQYKDLLSECFAANIQIDNEVITKEEADVLQDLEPDEVFENFKDLVKSLLEFKRFVRKAEETEVIEIENSNISTPAPEETQQFHSSLKNLSETNEELKQKIQILQDRLQSLQVKLNESEKMLKNKNEEILNLNALKAENEKLQKTVSQDNLHKRVVSEIPQSEQQKAKCTMIKSVKFEYFPSNPKVTSKVKQVKEKKSMNSNRCSPEKQKTTHSRSASNLLMLDFCKKIKKLR